MKIILLAPGLMGAQRGYERFVLELAAELRKAGLDAICWGTSAADGVEAIPTPGRNELQAMALARLGSDTRLRSITSVALQDWGIYTEDQLFAIPAAARIKELLSADESVLVYAKWQGGLVDPSGAPTELLKLLGAGHASGRTRLLVHTDYVYAPIDSLAWTAGATFHSVGPWISEQLMQIGVPRTGIAELPMSVHAAAYRNSRDGRVVARRELGIPPGAFVILSVGSFDTATPDKRHGHILDEILSAPGLEDVWWVVAGSRNGTATKWEENARSEMGQRFIPLMNVAFAQMPRIYGLADVFTLGSVNETFGLAYLEAQLAGLPVVMHDTIILRNLCKGLSPVHAPISLVDMQRRGAAAAALARWRVLVEGDGKDVTRTLLGAFAREQEKRYAWEFTGTLFADAFKKIGGSAAQHQMHGAADASISKSPPLGTWDEQSHRQALQLFEEGKRREALALLGKVLGGRETAERWNDWATVQMALGEPLEAEQGFRLALAQDPRNAQAAANLGAVLAAAGRKTEAVPYLEQASTTIDAAQMQAVTNLLEQCRSARKTHPLLNLQDLDHFLVELERSFRVGQFRPSASAEYCLAMLNAIPAGAGDERALCIGPAALYLSAALLRFKGYRDVRWSSGGADSYAEMEGAETLRLPADHFALTGDWPFEASSFDFVIAGQVLESLPDDPMHFFCEANRVLKAGGSLFLSAPNIASAKSMHSVLGGHSPYIQGHFRPRPCERHSREYTPEEIRVLTRASGFGVNQLRTAEIFWEASGKVFPGLAASGYSIGARGDTILLRARKEDVVRERFPAKLYDLSESTFSMDGRTAQFGDGNAAFDDVDRPLRILVIYENPLRPDRGGEDHRLLQILRILRVQGHSVTYLSPRGFEKEKYAHVLAELEIEAFAEDAQVLRREGIDVVPGWTLQGVLHEGQFDLAIISLWFWMCISLPEHYLDEIRRLSPRTRIAVLNDDCHALREARVANLSKLWSDRERAEDYALREPEILRAADFAMAISELDCNRCREVVPDIDIELLPMMVSAGPAGNDFERREGLMYLADYSNPASRDGIDWYLKCVAPIVSQALPDVKLYLVGTSLPADLGAGDETLVRVGFAPDLAVELGQRRILISPVRYGTGIKTKNLHAMSHGVPIVTTEIGSEGMDLIHGKTALIADHAEDFARAVIELYTDRTLWESVSRLGREHILQHFSKQKLASQLQVVANKTRKMQPRRFDSSHTWPVRRVERYFPEVTTHYPARDRLALRVLAYIRSAEQLLAQGSREEARSQLRHVFSFVPSRLSYLQFFSGFSSMVENMERTYRLLGEDAAASEFRQEARIYLPWAFPRLTSDGKLEKSGIRKDQKHQRSKNLDFSVVIPTFNRRETLSQCLDALARQSFGSHRFEAIVVDDGSTDDTGAFCKKFKARYDLRYFHQENAGAGAARRLGVEQARGKYIVLFNDDTIADTELLSVHFRVHREKSQDKVAVLGDFQYPPEAKSRALLHFLSTEPFLFPQVTLEAGLHSKNAYFVASNLSVPRDALLSAGSFDPRFRIAEDTELGVRLRQHGFSVLYVPEAKAVHQHLSFTMDDLVRRADSYGRTQVLLFAAHPRLLGDGTGPFGKLDEEALESIRAFIRKNSSEVPSAVQSIAQFDSLDFLPYFSRPSGTHTAADDVMNLFKRALPSVFWYYLFAGFLAAWEGTSVHASIGGRQPVLETR